MGTVTLLRTSGGISLTNRRGKRNRASSPHKRRYFQALV